MSIDLCQRIRSQRQSGIVHCGIIETPYIKLKQLAKQFDLSPMAETYQLISRRHARILMQKLLHKDLAYGSKNMSITQAEKLTQEFLGQFDPEQSQYYTNGDFYRDQPVAGWMPATMATFDSGILVLSPMRAGCFWVEDED